MITKNVDIAHSASEKIVLSLLLNLEYLRARGNSSHPHCQRFAQVLGDLAGAQ